MQAMIAMNAKTNSAMYSRVSGSYIGNAGIESGALGKRDFPDRRIPITAGRLVLVVDRPWHRPESRVSKRKALSQEASEETAVIWPAASNGFASIRLVRAPIRAV
jgi:hypothetical protein